MQDLESQVKDLFEKYTKEKQQVTDLKESIHRVKQLKSELFNIKQANRQRVVDLQKELDELKSRQNNELE